MAGGFAKDGAVQERIDVAAARTASYGDIFMTIRRLFGLASLTLLLAQPVALADEALTLKEIMQGLRDSLVQMGDGLLGNDLELVAQGALSIAEPPKIPPEQVQLVAAALGQEMPVFKQLDLLVHDLALEVHAAATARDRRAAIDGYQRMIEGCFACHEAYKDRVAAVLADVTAD